MKGVIGCVWVGDFERKRWVADIAHVFNSQELPQFFSASLLMFEDLIKEMRKLGSQRINISVPIGVDEKGYADRECPSEKCKYFFKVYNEDWANLFKDEEVYCPRCRHAAPSDQWWSEEQIARAKEQALQVGKNLIGRALIRGAAAANRKQPKDSFLKMSLRVSGTTPRPIIVPIAARDAMELEIQCEECRARFAVIGCGYFCPCCGVNSIIKTFDDSMRKVKAKVENQELIRTALLDAGKVDEAEITCQSFLESGLQDCVVAFQRLCDVLFNSIPDSPKPPSNAFQRLEQGSKFWKRVLNEGYEDWMGTSELNSLNILSQKRHLLAHCEGIVDEKYLTNTRDPDYQLGQRIVISEGDVLKMVGLVTELANQLRLRVDKL